MKKKENNGTFKSLWSVISILLIPLIFFIGKCNEKEMDDGRIKENSLYPRIEESFSKEYKGIVIYSKISKFTKGKMIIKLSNGEKFSDSSDTRNYNYSSAYLMFFIQVGDSIYKPADTDSIYIYRGKKVYYFRLGKDIK